MSLTVGIVGLRRMGARWMDIVRDSSHRLVACHDAATAPYALAQNPELAGLFASDENAFWTSSPDILIVATTAPGHAPWIAKGIEREIRRFVVEKPFTTSCDESTAIMARAKNAGARVIVNHGREYSPNYRRLSEVAAAFGIGPLRSIMLSSGAGGTGCVGIHFLRLFNQLFDSFPLSVLAHGTTPRGANPRGDQYDDPGCSALLLYPDERRAYIDIGDDVGIPPRLDLIFERGRIAIDTDVNPWRFFHRTDEGLREPLTRYEIPLIESLFPGFVPFDIFQMARAALMDAASDSAPICGMNKGHEAMLIFAAVRWSMRTGQIATVPLPAEALSRRYMIP